MKARSHGPSVMLAAALMSLLLAIVFRPVPTAAGSWFIDEGAFLASGHESMSCTDCHADQAKDHPANEDVGKAATTAFSRELCLNCHDGVESELAAGRHGGGPLEKGRDYAACVSCHDPHRPTANAKGGDVKGDKPGDDALAGLAPDVAACLRCHGLVLGGGKPAASSGAASFNKDAAPKQPAMCLACHGPSARDGAPRMADAKVTHGDMNCLACHTEAARFPHDGQKRVDCLTCHARHDEKTIHDAHSRVTCGACHLSGVTPTLRNGVVDFVVGSEPLEAHAMRPAPGTESCARCHASSGPSGAGAVGATSAILPPKSVICMGCHPATFSVQDAPSRSGLAVFILGFLFIAALWFTGGGLRAGMDDSAPDSANAAHHGHEARGGGWWALILDVLLQRRLFRESPARWFAHALIFFPFLFRFTWGLAALLGSLWAPAEQWPWLLLAKDWSVGAFLFDVSGLALLVGLTWAGVLWIRGTKPAPNAPGHDWLGLILLLGITLTGFLLEGVRIALTGMPEGSACAFVGHALAEGLVAAGPAALADAHAFLWNAHAVITAATVAWIPFGQLRHVFTAPLFMLVQTLRGRR